MVRGSPLTSLTGVTAWPCHLSGQLTDQGSSLHQNEEELDFWFEVGTMWEAVAQFRSSANSPVFPVPICCCAICNKRRHQPNLYMTTPTPTPMKLLSFSLCRKELVIPYITTECGDWLISSLDRPSHSSLYHTKSHHSWQLESLTGNTTGPILTQHRADVSWMLDHLVTLSN